MEETHRSHAFLSVLIIFLSSFILLSHSLAPPGTIQRTTKQQLLASLPPSDHDTASSQLFLISPSGKYRVYLLRRETSLGAGGFGNDFCYLQVQDSAAGVSVWESDCTSVSNVNTCTLLFSEAGLEIFDGSQSAWDNDVDGENLETLVLMDSGDMQIRDKDGDMAWKASDNPVVNQNCGSIGAPGLAPDHPTFGSPIHDDSTGPFGQPAVDSPVQQPHHDQLGVQQPPHQLGNSSPGPEEENQPQQVLTVSPGEQEPVASSVEENNQLPQEPAASPEEENNQLPQEPAASPEEENNHLPQEPAANNRLPQEPAASPEEENQTPHKPAATPEEEHQPQQEPAASPEAEHHHHQRQPGSPEEGGLSNNPSSSLGHHPVGARNQPTTYLNQQQQPIPVGVAAHQQPLIDNTPFDSGSSREKPSKFRVTLVFLLTTLIVYNFFLLG